MLSRTRIPLPVLSTLALSVVLAADKSIEVIDRLDALKRSLKSLRWLSLSRGMSGLAIALALLGTPARAISQVLNTIVGNGVFGYSGDGGPGTAAQIGRPDDIAVDAAGNLYIASGYNNAVRKLTVSTGVITTIAGTGTQGYSGDGGPATTAQLNFPDGIAVDSAGNLYIADMNNSVVRKVTASSGVITTVAGNGTEGYAGDGGAATSAELAGPSDLKVDSAGNLYIVDTFNNVVRKVTASTGLITTVAGDGGFGYSGDGGPATSALMAGPQYVVLDAAGNLYIADEGNSVIRKVAASTGVITTFAGNGSYGYSGDGGPATSAELSWASVSMDTAGNFYLADSGNNVVRKIAAATGIITTIVGNGTAGYSGDGGSAIGAELNTPYTAVVDSVGNVFVADSYNYRIRAIGPVVPTPTFSPLPGSYSSAQSVSISDTFVGANIYYTTDGSTPTTSSTLYTSTLAIASSTTLKAIATAPGYGNSAVGTATYTIGPPITVQVSPSSASLQGGQTQQFSATVANTSNTAVSWTISPSVGTIDSSGLYTAPATISTQQTVTVTATSQADTTKSTSAVVTLSPPQCTWSSPYAYGRIILIDHTKVPNTDETDFPVLISGTYPFLATIANGGKVQNSNGYDIIFTSDPAGQNLLDFEIDNYSPVTGAAAFWVRIPTLSHITDTPIYMWYGNANVSVSQENKAGVWSNGYAAVYHMGNGSTLNTIDSTGKNGTASNSGVTAGAGAIGGAGNFSNGTTFLDIGGNAALKPSSALTLEAWVNARSLGDWNKIIALDYRANGTWNSPFLSYALQSFNNTNQMGFQITQAGSGTTASTQGTVALNSWHQVVGTYDGTQVIEYLDSVSGPSLPLNGAIDYGTSQDITIGFDLHIRSPPRRDGTG